MSLTVALPKGKLLKPCTELFRRIGFKIRDQGKDDRRLLVSQSAENIQFMFIRAIDVPTYVEHGAADMGIVGKDVLLEQEHRDLYEPLDLKFGFCRIVVAEAKGKSKKPVSKGWTKLRIATKYPRITERYFSQKGFPVEIIKLYGSIELAPLVGLAEQIVDLSSTGRTLKEHQLVEVEEIGSSTARVVVNRASLKIKNQRIGELLRKLQKGLKKDYENR